MPRSRPSTAARCCRRPTCMPGPGTRGRIPDFPGRTAVWHDTPNYELGHWLTGRLGEVPLKWIIAELCAAAGVPAFDTSALMSPSTLVLGYATDALSSPRDILAGLMDAHQFDARESGGELQFFARGNVRVTALRGREPRRRGRGGPRLQRHPRGRHGPAGRPAPHLRGSLPRLRQRLGRGAARHRQQPERGAARHRGRARPRLCDRHGDEPAPAGLGGARDRHGEAAALAAGARRRRRRHARLRRRHAAVPHQGHRQRAPIGRRSSSASTPRCCA